MTNENQQPTEETPAPDFINQVIHISTCAPTLYTPAYKNDEEPPQEEKND